MCFQHVFLTLWFTPIRMGRAALLLSGGGLQLKHSYAICPMDAQTDFFQDTPSAGTQVLDRPRQYEKRLPPRACCTFIRATFHCYGWSRLEYLPAICGAQRGRQKLEHCYAICYTCFSLVQRLGFMQDVNLHIPMAWGRAAMVFWMSRPPELYAK